MSIHPFLRSVAFEPDDIQAMSVALDDVCVALKVPLTDNRARDVIATRIIDLAGRGEHDSIRLRDRVLREAAAASASGI
jgi:hypothetical protein